MPSPKYQRGYRGRRMRRALKEWRRAGSLIDYAPWQVRCYVERLFRLGRSIP